MKNSVAFSLRARTVKTQQPAATRQRPVNNREIMFSTRSMTRCYKQDKLSAGVSEDSRLDLKPRMTVLARTSINLSDRQRYLNIVTSLVDL
jgi:hypothetical protein